MVCPSSFLLCSALVFSNWKLPHLFPPVAGFKAWETGSSFSLIHGGNLCHFDTWMSLNKQGGEHLPTARYKSWGRCRKWRVVIFLTLKWPQLPLKLIIMFISTAAFNLDLGGVSSSYEWMLGDIWYLGSLGIRAPQHSTLKGPAWGSPGSLHLLLSLRKRRLGCHGDRTVYIARWLCPKRENEICKIWAIHKPHIIPACLNYLNVEAGAVL